MAGLNTALNVVNWDSAFNGHNETIDCIYDKWINLFNSIVDVYIPIKHVTIRSKDKPWMNGSIRIELFENVIDSYLFIQNIKIQ